LTVGFSFGQEIYYPDFWIQAGRVSGNLVCDFSAKQTSFFLALPCLEPAFVLVAIMGAL